MGLVDTLHLPADSPLHRVPAHTKLVATGVLVVAMVASPREAIWVHATFAALLVALALVARVGLARLARRLVVGIPVVAAALLLPVMAQGPRVEVLGLVHLSEEGLWAGWNVLAKATLGLAATTLLVATTPVADLLRGLERLHVPAVFTAVATFMVRYVEVLAQELHRLQVARVSRAHDPRWFWQARAVAATAGSLFVRAFERGERVHHAMVSRGFDGSFPAAGLPAASVGVWCAALAVPAVAVVLSAVAWAAA